MVQKQQQICKIRILFFTASLGGGGAEKHLLRLVNHLDRQRFSCSVAIANPGGTYEAELANDVRFYPLNPKNVKSSTIRMIRAFLPLRRLIKREQPDILCTVMDHASAVGILASYGLKNKPKITLSIQNPPSFNYSRPWHPVHRLILWLLPRLYPRADRVVALSNGVAADIGSIVPQVRDRTQVIYNAGVDAQVYSMATQSVTTDVPLSIPTPLLVACGRLHEQKDYPCLLEALVEVRKEIPAHLWIVGEGKLRQTLEQKIEQYQLADCVRLVGFQNNPYQYMAIADVFVLSSRFEGFGNVIVEAMACGTPVVATDCPYGPGEIISSGINGILVPPADSKALAAGIVKVLTDNDLKQRLSKEGLNRAQDFDVQTIASAYSELFTQLLPSTKA